MEKIVLMPIIVAFAFLFFSCSTKEPVFEIVQGNILYSGGDYMTTSLCYYNALKKTGKTEWIRYDLGNVFNSLGEPEYAITELEGSLTATDRELVYRAHFNLGSIFFEAGKFDESVEHFKAALKAKPDDKDAKRNLEIAAKRLDTEESRSQSLSQSMSLSADASETLKDAHEKEVYLWTLGTAQTGTENSHDW
jgi:tetratricopeptide (TPR) repeat protein